jgi:hypothetical protein
MWTEAELDALVSSIPVQGDPTATTLSAAAASALTAAAAALALAAAATHFTSSPHLTALFRV